MSSTFDPTAFEEQIIEGENATSITPPPEGDGYLGLVDDYKFDTVGDDKKPVCNVMIKLLDDPRLGTVGLNADAMPPIRHTLWLDLAPDGRLARGPNQNTQLGALREALGQNKPGERWQWALLRGAGPISMTIAHREAKDGNMYPDIKKITAPK